MRRDGLSKIQTSRIAISRVQETITCVAINIHSIIIELDNYYDATSDARELHVDHYRLYKSAKCGIYILNSHKSTLGFD